MLDFRPLEIICRDRFLPYMAKRSQTCDRTFTNLFCWQDYYHTLYAEYEGWMVVRVNINGERRVAYVVLSQEDEPYYPDIIPLVEEDADRLEQPLSLIGLAESECEMLQRQLPGEFLFDKNRDFADYIYRVEDLRLLKGRKYAQKRNHVNKFKSLYAYHYEPLTVDHIEDCMRLERSWTSQHTDLESAQAEFETIQRAFRHFEELQLRGGVLYVDNRIVAFTYGSAINPEMFCTHVEKADIRYEGVYQMINHQFALHLPENFLYINREEDLGVPGLRKSKMSYEPFRLAYKAQAMKSTSDMHDIVRIWHRCFGEDDSVYPFLARYYFNDFTEVERLDGQVVSMVSMIPCHTDCGFGVYLYGVATDPEYQHRGISSKLILRSLEKCKKLDAAFIFLIPSEDRLVPFYGRFGFKPAETRALFHSDMDLGTGDTKKDRILVLSLIDSWKRESLPELLNCTPML